MIKKTLLYFSITLVVTLVIYGQTPKKSLVGTYYNSGSPIALNVEQLSDGNYIFRMVLIRSNGKIVPIESQSAFVMPTQDSKYVFYWHTGRYQDIPGTDSIIVYVLTYDGNDKLDGYYYFPENPKTPKAVIKYSRVH